MRHFKCEDEGAYLAYVTEIRDTQKGRKVRMRERTWRT